MHRLRRSRSLGRRKLLLSLLPRLLQCLIRELCRLCRRLSHLRRPPRRLFLCDRRHVRQPHLTRHDTI